MTALPACPCARVPVCPCAVVALVLVKRATGRERKVSRTVRRRRRPCPSPRSTDPYVAWCCGRPGLRFWVEPGSRSCTVYCGYQSILRMGEVDEEQGRTLGSATGTNQSVAGASRPRPRWPQVPSAPENARRDFLEAVETTPLSDSCRGWDWPCY